jgi:Flp pilus assembly protein CpaB
MKRKQSFYFLVLGTFLSGIAAFLVITFLNQMQQQVSVVVATTDLQPFQEITAQDVTMIQVPNSSLVDKQVVVTNADKVIGKYTSSYVSKDSFLNASNVTKTPGGPIVIQLNTKQNANLRAMELPVKEKSLQRKIKTGDHVDLLGTFPVTKSVNGVMQNVKDTQVLADYIEVLSTNFNASDKEGKDNTDGTIIISVEEDKAKQITEALAGGNVTMLVEPTETNQGH